MEYTSYTTDVMHVINYGYVVQYNKNNIIIVAVYGRGGVRRASRTRHGEKKKRAGLDVAPARRGVARVDADSPEGSETHRARGNVAGRAHTHTIAARRYIPPDR